MEQSFEEFIVQRIGEKNPLHLKKVRRNLKRMKSDPDFEPLSAAFYRSYDAYLGRIGKTRAHAVDSYLRMIDDFIAETVRFSETGKYTSTSFAEVNARVYAQPDVMDYYMHGLLLTQFIWTHHYELLKFYSAQLEQLNAGRKSYLEIGGGHGLYLNMAKRLLRGEWSFTVVDISATSLEIARNFADNEGVSFVQADVFQLDDSYKADLIVMGEVLEHLEDPLAILQKLRGMLNEDGVLFITTPTNAPAIDHIYLFRNRAEIRDLIHAAGLEIVTEKCFSSEDLPLEEAEALNISILYSAFLRKQ